MNKIIDMDDIEKSVVHLLTNKGVFYASLLSQMKRIADLKFEHIAGVAIRNGYIELYWNPERFAELKNIKEKVAVLEHEAHHLVKNHIARLGNRDFKMWNVACVPGDTHILGANVDISKITSNMSAFQVDGTFSKINSVITRNYKGRLIGITPSCLLPAKFTEEHPILVYRKKYQNHTPITLEKLPTWVLAKDIKVGDYVVIPKLLPTVKDQSLSLDSFINNTLSNNHTQNHNIKKKLRNCQLPLTEELAWVLGFYVADGSLNNGKRMSGLNFALSPDNDIDNCERLKRYFLSFGYKVPIVASKSLERFGFHRTAIKLSCSSSLLAKAFSQWCGRGAKNKKMPEFILFHENINIVKAFLKGYFSGDGCQTGIDNYVAGTVSKTLALQLQLAILRLGDSNFASLRCVKNNGLGTNPIYRIEWRHSQKTTRKLQNKIISSYSYRWKETPEYYLVPVRKVTAQNYDGIVYNLSTKTHTFVVNNFVTHNCDLTINQTIDDLPEFVLQVDHPVFKKMGMTRNKPAEQYYNILKQNAKHIQFGKGKDGKMKMKVKNGDGSGEEEFDVESPNSHEKWNDGKADSPDIQEEVIRQSVKKAVDQVERQQGRIPGDLLSDIEALNKPPIIPWQRILRQWVGMKVKAGHKYSWKRPNKRYGMTQKGKIPVRKLVIAVGIDTSGSIGDDDLQAFMVEINGIMASYKSVFWIIECDYDVQKVYKLTPQTKVDPKFKGRGGTSFVPVFDHIKAKNLDVDLLIYFTDLYGDFPKEPPRYPVLWVSISRDIGVPFGDTLILDRHGSKEYN